MSGNLLRGGAFSLISKLAEAVLSLAVVCLLALLLGAEGFGVYSFVIAIVSLISLPTRFGLPQLIVKETARGAASEQWSAVAGIWQWSVRASLGVAVASGAVVVLLVTSLDGIAGQIGPTLLIGLLLIPTLSLIALKSAMLRGLHHVGAANVTGLLVQPTVLICFLAFWTWGLAETAGPEAAMIMTVVAAMFALFVVAIAQSIKRPPAVSRAKPSYMPRSWIGTAWPMALTQGAHQISRYTDLLVLGILAGMIDAGIYRIATQGAMLISLGMRALGLSTAPDFARLHESGLSSELQLVIRRSAQAGLGFALAATVGFATLGHPFLGKVFGEEFEAAWIPLLILSGGHLVSTALGPTGLVLNMTGHERAVTRAVGIATGCNVALNLVLIPFFGVAGAAAATAISLVFWKTRLWFVARRELGVRCSAI